MGTILRDLIRDDQGALIASIYDPDAGGLGGVYTYPDLAGALDENVDVLVMFHNKPEDVVPQAELAVKYGVAVVIGTTAIPEEGMEALAVLGENAVVVQAPNFSPGANLFINDMERWAATLSQGPVRIVDIHHTGKKDWPSGTAVKLAEGVCAGRGWDPKDSIRQRKISVNANIGPGAKETGAFVPSPDDKVLILSQRKGDVVGFHEVSFFMPGETPSFRHDVESRDTFGSGALIAVTWAMKKGREHGLYHMNDVLGLAA